MKKILLLLSVAALTTSCKDPKGFAKISGKINNPTSDEIMIKSEDYVKTITLKEDGSFLDTLKVKSGIYVITDGINGSVIHLANGYNLDIDIKSANFEELSFKGNGSKSNEYIEQFMALGQSDFVNPKAYFQLDKEAFDAKIQKLRDTLESFNSKGVDSTLISKIKQDNEGLINYLVGNYDAQHTMAVKFAKGQPSPKFENLENYAGGTTSLDDLKGKYVYIDVWATWCGPCKQQIPYLQEMETKYHDKNIAFVSISIDNEKKHESWKKMITDRNMSGIQLYAGDQSKFAQEYIISSIPRFIIIDPEGNIVDANAPRPSDPELVDLFESLNI